MIQARNQAARRGSRHLAVEDLLFLIRHDRTKVNRLRTYLSWKDVRQKVKDLEMEDGLDPVESFNFSGELSRPSPSCCLERERVGKEPRERRV